MDTTTLLIVERDPARRVQLHDRFAHAGYAVVSAANGAEAIAALRRHTDLVLLDLPQPAANGLTLLKRVLEVAPGTPVIAVTSSIETDAAEAVQLGAYACVSSVEDLDAVTAEVARALRGSRWRGGPLPQTRLNGGPYDIDAIVAVCPAMLMAKALIERVAASPATTVLLTGATGTGKDLAAKVIHHNSRRAAKPLVTVTCSAMPQPLLESELFGHERDAFLDARQQKRGLLELADGGTVFLDGLNAVGPTVQAKLLRFLEERTFQRVGGLEEIHVDVRIIAATNRPLETDVEAGSFREELLYRLRVMPITLPPLRERLGDIPVLAAHFIERFKGELHKPVRGIAPAAMDQLERYHWPGNVRELRNTIERALLLMDGDRIETADLDVVPPDRAATIFELPPQGVDLREVERQLVLQALERAHGNQTRAGSLLGINRDQVRYRIDKFGLPAPGHGRPLHPTT